MKYWILKLFEIVSLFLCISINTAHAYTVAPGQSVCDYILDTNKFWVGTIFSAQDINSIISVNFFTPGQYYQLNSCYPDERYKNHASFYFTGPVPQHLMPGFHFTYVTIPEPGDVVQTKDDHVKYYRVDAFVDDQDNIYFHSPENNCLKNSYCCHR